MQVDKNKIDNLNKGVVPIFEPGLEGDDIKNLSNKTLSFTTKLKSVLTKTEFVFIAVGTPMGEDGSADLQYVLSVAKSIGRLMTKGTYHR